MGLYLLLILSFEFLLILPQSEQLQVIIHVLFILLPQAKNLLKAKLYPQLCINKLLDTDLHSSESHF
jgi:hypothetical protein